MKNKTGKKVLYYAILAILLGVFCFSGYQIYSYYSEQNASTSLNEGIVREYTIRKTGVALSAGFGDKLSRAAAWGQRLLSDPAD